MATRAQRQSEAPIFLRANEVDQAVRGMFAKNGYVVLSEVRNGTGFERKARTADMIAASTWPSRGLFIEGVEIKVSRSDLRRELETPQKADDIAKYCRFWWLAGPRGLIGLDMRIPETWGVIEVDEKLKATVSVKPKELEPVPMDALLACSLLRNFSESYIHRLDLEEKIKAEVERRNSQVSDRRDREIAELTAAVKTFREHSGVDLLNEFGRTRWDIADIGKAVAMVSGMRNHPVTVIQESLKQLRNVTEAVESVAKLCAPREAAS